MTPKPSQSLMLRFSLQHTQHAPQVVITAVSDRGEHVEKIPAESIGIHKKLSVQAYRQSEFSLPGYVLQRLQQALELTEQEQPLWLLIDRSARSLAVVPWERLLAGITSGPILRSPGFDMAPASIRGRPVLAICAGAPRAEELPPATPFVTSLVEQVRQAIPPRSEVHLFADRGTLERFGALGSSVVVHDPDLLPPVADPETTRSEPPEDIWLQWMAAELHNRNVAAVHFVCPGLLVAERGALALSRTPVENGDSDRTHLISAAELSRFLNRIGAWALFMSAPYDQVWALALRLLADEIARTRPGPIVLSDGATPVESVGRAYRFLFSREKPPTGGDLLLSCHPRLVGGDDWQESVAERFGVDEERPRRRFGLQTRSPRDKKGVGPTGRQREPRWARLNRLAIRQAEAALTDRYGDTTEGSKRAIAFLSQLHARYWKDS